MEQDEHEVSHEGQSSKPDEAQDEVLDHASGLAVRRISNDDLDDPLMGLDALLTITRVEQS